MDKKSLFQVSIDVQTLVQFITDREAAAPYSMISYQDMSREIGRDVRHGILNSARKILQREKSWVFGTIATKGITRMTDEEVAESGENSRDRIRREATRGVRRLSCVEDFDKMPKPSQLKHNANMSFLGAVVSVSRASTVKKLENAIETSKNHAALPSAETLKVLIG